MKSAILIGMVVAIGAITEPATSQQRTITLPNETATYVASQLPGYQLVQRNCAG